MLNAFFTLIKLLLFVGIITFLIQLEGSIELRWGLYVVNLHLGLALAIFTFSLIAILFAHRILMEFVHFPKSLRRYWRDKNIQKSHDATTRALVSMAAGDHKHAAYHAYRAQKLLPSDFSSTVPIFLEAQAARFQGQHERAHKNFKALLESQESSFLGVRGLMQTRLEAGEYGKALEMAYEVQRKYPKQSWVLKAIYSLELQTAQWPKALETLKQLQKKKALESEQAQSDKKVLFMLLGEHAKATGDNNGYLKYSKRALSIDSGFTPAVLNIAKYYIDQKKNKKAAALIEKAWLSQPHPDLVTLWDVLAPENTPKKPMARLHWYEKLLALNPHAIEGQLALARAAVNDGHWAEARAYLTTAERTEKNVHVYSLWAELEQASTSNEEAVQLWLNKARSAKPSKMWVCTLTGRIYDQWFGVAHPHASFNTIIWDYPNRPKNMGSTDSTKISADFTRLLSSY